MNRILDFVRPLAAVRPFRLKDDEIIDTRSFERDMQADPVQAAGFIERSAAAIDHTVGCLMTERAVRLVRLVDLEAQFSTVKAEIEEIEKSIAVFTEAAGRFSSMLTEEPNA